MPGKAIFWGIVMLAGIWLRLWKKELELLGIIILIIGLGFGLKEWRKGE